MKKQIVISTQFSATHNFPDCSIPEVIYLQHQHRHVFQIKMKFSVSHNNRDIEFIIMKQEVEKHIAKEYAGKFLGKKSCEMIAEELMEYFGASFVSVYEDGENGAEIEE